ncbi:MAG: hotdog domain-containing protein [Aerococcus sp.]|nr:hotdog domain-containing protein [Aerococcus sp.]
MQRKVTCAETFSVHGTMVLPQDANQYGMMYGGQLLKDVDNAASMSGIQFCRCPGVTGAVDNLNFLRGFPIGNHAITESYVSGHGKRSMEIFIKIIGENPETGERYLGASGFVTFVATPKDKENFILPELVPETDEEKLICSGYADRQQRRLAQRHVTRELEEQLTTDYRHLTF